MAALDDNDDDPDEDGAVNDRGFSLVELLVALTIVLVVFASVCDILSPAHATALVQAEMQDMQQRARVLTDRMTRDLRLAGAGLGSGTRRGSLEQHFAPVLPALCCGPSADPAGSAFRDRLTAVYEPYGSPEALLAAPVDPDSLRLDVTGSPSCASAPPACGFADGDVLAVFDDTGRYDFFTLVFAAGVPMLRPFTAAFDARYEPGATVCRVVIHSYLRDAVSSQLFAAEGVGAAQPFVDGVSALSFEYADAAALVPFPALADGPWLGAGATTYDADLLRVRRVRVSFSLRSALSGRGAMRLPDLTSSFDIAMRNARSLP